MTSYESEIKTISQPQETVFNLLSDLNNLKKVQNMNVEGREKFESYFEELEVEQDAVFFSVTGIGRVGFRIVEREPFKTIKLTAENSPISANGWIQLVGISEQETKMKLTIKADIPMMVKMMVDKKLKQGIDTIAEALAKILNEVPST